MSIYNEFAELYDGLMNDFDYKEWAEYIEDIFKRYNKKPRNILEMACGTGNLTYELAEKGYNINGFDLSDEMLAIAYKKLNRYRNVKVFNQDMVDFDLNKKFDTVISICDSINYILYEDDLLKVFENVYRHLEDDGIFIFDINSFYKLENIIGNNIFVHNTEEVFYTWENQFDAEEEISDFFLTFFVKDKKDKNYYRFNEQHSEKAYRVEKIVELLDRVGFKDIEYFKGFTFEDVKKTTERINFVAFK